MTILDGYRVAKCLSSGEHTQVHSAIRERDGLRVVLKVHTGSSAAVRAEREFQALRTARGPGVPEAFELQRQGESAVLALAHVDGSSLAACRDSVAQQPLATLLHVILELAECIAHVHQTRILHKDIRPENVLIDRVAQRPWLIDFGRSALRARLRHARAAVAPLRQISHDAMEMGDREYAQYAFAQWACARAFSGVPLNVFESDYAEYMALFPHGFVNRSLEALQWLSRPVDDSTIDAELARVDTMFAERPMLSVHWRLAWMLTLCVLNRPADAFAQSERLRDATTMETLRVDLAFFRGLSAADLASAGGARRRELRRAVKSSIRQLAAWARHGPDYVHMVEILRAALRGRTDLARAGYVAAARRAQQQGYLHHAALACEREARLLAQMRRDTEAGASARSARHRVRAADPAVFAARSDTSTSVGPPLPGETLTSPWKRRPTPCTVSIQGQFPGSSSSDLRSLRRAVDSTHRSTTTPAQTASRISKREMTRPRFRIR